MAIALSILALLATFYQLYLQRVHNERSLKPLLQIDLYARDNLIAVRVQNNGLGPYIVERLSYTKDREIYNSIRQCVSLDPKSYHNVSITQTVKKVILPNTHLDVFSVCIQPEYTTDYVDNIKRELSLLKLKVVGRDVYDNVIIAQRDLDWFVKYLEI